MIQRYCPYVGAVVEITEEQLASAPCDRCGKPLGHYRRWFREGGTMWCGRCWDDEAATSGVLDEPPYK
jgi:hypothetical protein